MSNYFAGRDGASVDNHTKSHGMSEYMANTTSVDTSRYILREGEHTARLRGVTN